MEINQKCVLQKECVTGRDMLIIVKYELNDIDAECKTIGAQKLELENDNGTV